MRKTFTFFAMLLLAGVLLVSPHSTSVAYDLDPATEYTQVVYSDGDGNVESTLISSLSVLAKDHISSAVSVDLNYDERYESTALLIQESDESATAFDLIRIDPATQARKAVGDSFAFAVQVRGIWVKHAGRHGFQVVFAMPAFLLETKGLERKMHKDSNNKPKEPTENAREGELWKRFWQEQEKHYKQNDMN